MTFTNRLNFGIFAQDHASQVFSHVGQAVGGLSAKMATAAAAIGVSFAGVGGMLTESIGAAFDQMDIKSKLQAQLGTTNDVAAKQGKIAGHLYSSGVSDSFQEAADAIKATVQAGLAPPDATNRQLEKIATKAQDVATVFDQDLGGVTRAVSQLLRTGLAKSADEAFDILTKGFQAGNDKAGDLLDTVNEYGVQFKKAGVDGQQAMGLISQAIKAGARDADKAADAIKEFSIRAVDGSATTADGFKRLGLNADEMARKFSQGGSAANAVLDITLDRLRGMKDHTKQAQIATELFGTQAEDLGAALFAMDPTTAAKKLGNFAGAADQMGKTIRSGPRHQIEVFKRTIEQSLVNFLGDTAIPALTNFSGSLGNVIPVEKIKAGFRQAQVVIGDFVRGLLGTGKQEVRPPALKAPEVPKFLQRPQSDAQQFGATVRELGVQLAKDLKPLAETALGIGKAFIQIATHTPAPVFKTIVEVMIATAITKRIIALAGAFRTLATSMTISWVAAAGPIGLIVGGTLALAYAFSEASGQGHGLSGALEFLGQAIVGPYGILGAIRAIGDAFVYVFSPHGGLAKHISDFNNWLKDKGGDLIDGFLSGVKDAWHAVSHWFTDTMPNAVVRWVKSGFGIASPAKRMIPLGGDVIRGFLSGVLGAAAGIGNWLMRHVVSPALRVFRPSGSWLPGPGRSLISGLKSGIGGGISGIGSWLSRTVVSPITRRFSGARNWLPSPGRLLISGLKSGMSGAMRGISGWVKSVIVNPIVKFVRQHFGINSPSRVFMSIGRSLIKGLFMGMAKRNPREMITKIFGGLPDALGALVSRGLISISSLPSKALKALGGLGSKLGSIFGNLFGGGGAKVGSGVQRWAPIVSQVLSMLGAPGYALGAVLKRIQMESGGNPNAINLWDINAKHGDPSRGLMQTIGSTFRAYAGPFSGRGIYDPLANIYAGVNYAMHRYGRNWINVMTRPGGYDQGGIATGMGYLPKYTPEPERVLSPRQTAAFERLVDMLESGGVGGGGGYFEGQLVLDSGELLGKIRGTVAPMIHASEQRSAFRAKVGRR
ncbi:phage tail tape measure protein [Streptomyces sp. NPDC005708]|uniref:phage tail tape measure protein n=1 Tax=Streptomyces sp. NPDC005708 TaxID=3154564 RepID=UPI0033F77829